MYLLDVLVPQTSLGPNTASNSNPKPAYGKNQLHNQKKKEKREQFAADGVINPARNLTPRQSPAAAVVESPGPMVAQPARMMVAEAMPDSDAQQGAGYGRVEDGTA